MLKNTKSTNNIPLAQKVRPSTFEEFWGQEHIYSSKSLLKAIIDSLSFSSLIFWGPSGTGKTTLAQIIANHAKLKFVSLSAVQSSVKEIREYIEHSQTHINQGQNPILIFMDEIHRLNTAQQDVLLPSLEHGIIKFIGATSENPSFKVNNSILSRSLIFKFNPLKYEVLIKILKRAINLTMLNNDITIDDEVIKFIAHLADSDARRALNYLEAILETAKYYKLSNINMSLVSEYFKDIIVKYDKNKDNHYELISAFIKSIRANDPDAAVYYLARMLEGGEDPMFIARRLVILASEDIGNANPTALILATNAMHAVHMIGLPEARIILSQITTYLAASVKSNRAYEAIEKAIEDVKKYGSLPLPLFLLNAPTKLLKDLEYGKNYIYPHHNLKDAQKLQYLPNPLENKEYYKPLDIGHEKILKQNLSILKPKKFNT